MKLRIEKNKWTPFVADLCARSEVETAGIILAEQSKDGDVLIAKHLLLVPEDGYEIRKCDQLRITPVTLNRLVRRARDEGLSILTVHTHPGTHLPWFSMADDAGDDRLMPSFCIQTPGPHGSLVIAGESGIATARIWRDQGVVEALDLIVVGQSLELSAIQPGCTSADDGAFFSRQELALGEEGQAALRRLHVGIVGLGGTGSACLVQLAHLGVAQISLVDGDLVEPSNVSRVFGSSSGDAWKTPKVDVAERYARERNLGTEIRVLPGYLGVQVEGDDLVSCDIILSCVDRHTPRARLNRLAYEQLIPVIDMGNAFRVDRAGRVVSGAGRVVIIGPGRPCLACWGHIDPDQLRIEALPKEEKDREMEEGYIDGARVPEPSVMAFNTTVAGAAIVEFLRLVTRFAGSEDPPLRLAFDFVEGTVRRNQLANWTGCTICSCEGAASRSGFVGEALAGEM